MVKEGLPRIPHDHNRAHTTKTVCSFTWYRKAQAFVYRLAPKTLNPKNTKSTKALNPKPKPLNTLSAAGAHPVDKLMASL